MGKYSQYTGVTKAIYNDSSREKSNNKPWEAYGRSNGEHGRQWRSRWKTEREAAIAYDKKMIELGRPPVNKLKPVQ